MVEKNLEILEVEDETIEKKATIRGESVRACPFALPIPEACENVGSAINRMAPTEDEKVSKANRIVYAYHKCGKQCPYADKILKEYKKVDCNFGDTAAGKKSVPFRGSPLYPNTFVGIGLDGLYGYPLSFYSDNNESRNLFFGLFSLLGAATTEQIIKLANDYDVAGEKEKADILDGLLKRLEQLKKDYKETFEKVEKYLQEYRMKYELDRDDTGLLWDLTDSWYGPRQINR